MICVSKLIIRWLNSCADIGPALPPQKLCFIAKLNESRKDYIKNLNLNAQITMSKHVHNSNLSDLHRQLCFKQKKQTYYKQANSI